MEQKRVLEKIAAAKEDVVDAEDRLDIALRDTRRAPRAEKTTVTELVQDALVKIQKARADLEELERLVSSNEQ